MREKRVPDSTWICEVKGFTVGDLKRTLNKTKIIKIASVIDIEIDTYHNQGKVCVKTEAGEIIELELIIFYSTSEEYLSKVCLVYILDKDSKKIYDISWNINENKKKNSFKIAYIGEEIYKDCEIVGRLSFSENSVFGAMKFDNNTGLHIYAGRKRHGLYALFGDELPRDNYEDHIEFGNYFMSIRLPINIQAIYESVNRIFVARQYEYVDVYSFDSLTSDLEDVQNYIDRLAERLISCYTVEEGNVTVHTTVDGNVSFTVYKDNDYWIYSDGEVVIRNMPIVDSKPTRLKVTISFKDEETALKRMGNINLERIVQRIAELQKQLSTAIE